MSFQWVYARPDDEQAISVLQQQLGISQKVALLLALRGIDSYDRAKSYFRPNLNSIHDPFLMKDMDKATERLARAIRNRERVLVYGDYDVDGTTAASLRSEEHTSELQSRGHLVCRLLLEKK